MEVCVCGVDCMICHWMLTMLSKNITWMRVCQLDEAYFHLLELLALHLAVNISGTVSLYVFPFFS